MKTTTINCDHCGRVVAEKDVKEGYENKSDYCPECYAEQQGVFYAGSNLDEALKARWEAGGLPLTGGGVATVNLISPHETKLVPKYVFSVLTVKPLDDMAGDFWLGPYLFKDFRDKHDKCGESGFDIYRDTKRVAIIRWRKMAKGGPRWEHALYWDKDKPGELRWNTAEADNIQNLGEAIQLALQDLETEYDTWANNLEAKSGQLSQADAK